MLKTFYTILFFAVLLFGVWMLSALFSNDEPVIGEEPTDRTVTVPVFERTPTSPEVVATEISLVRAKDGSLLPVPFLIEGESVKMITEGFYDIAYDPDLTELYAVNYDQVTNSISIGLYREPLGEVRRLAEQALTDTLQLNNDQLCFLDIIVFTNNYVSQEYGGIQNLGLSFCAGSVRLD